MRLRIVAVSMLCVCAYSVLGQTASFSDVYTFTGGASGEGPGYGLTLAGDGSFYGIDSAGLFKLTPAGQVTIPLVTPANNDLYGSSPISGADGAVYLADITAPYHSCGGIYRVDLAGNASTFYQFSCDSENGSFVSGLILGSNGSFYGLGSDDYYPDGFVYQLSSSGQLTVLHPYASAGDPTLAVPVLQSSDGSIYLINGAENANQDGAIYKLNTAGNYTLIHAFQDEDDGGDPSALVEASDGNVYGVSGGFDFNVLFSIAPDGSFTIINSSLKGSPYSAANLIAGYQLTLGSDGNLYSEDSAGQGGFFQVTLSGQFSALYTINFNNGYGSAIDSGLIQGSDGAFYGEDSGSEQQLSNGQTDEGDIFRLAVSTVTAPPIHLSFSEETVSVGDNVILNWSVANAFSLTAQQCFAYIQNGATGAGSWSGAQTGTVANDLYQGSATITPTAPGFYTYALTCGGIESGFASLNVGGKSATSTVFVTNSPIIIGTEATLTATPTSRQSVGALTGTVTYSFGGLQLGTVNLAGGSAILNIPTGSLPTGTYAITATYSGDANYLSSAATQNVTILGYATSATLTATPTTVAQGQPVTLRATVGRTVASGTPSGTVAFYYETYELGTASLSGGSATLNFVIPVGIPPGTYVLRATYSGDGSDQGATSQAVGVTVIAATATSLSISPNPVPADSAATFNVTVAQTYGTSVPTGTVTFEAGGSSSSPITLVDGAANLNLSDIGVPAGTYPVTATYSGDANNAASSSTGDVTIE